ncbi:MAG: helix-turn-helix domain-containing protein [Burkholderiales bacterium]
MGDHLRKRRLELGLLQRELAEQLGINVQSLRNWEQHRSNPKVYLIPRIVDFLGYAPLETPRTFAETLRTYRRGAGLSQERLAKLARIDESTIAKWERGDTRPMASTLRRLRRFFARRGVPMPAGTGPKSC